MYQFMCGNFGAGMLFFGIIIYLLIIVLLFLGVIAVWRFLDKK